MRRVVSSRDPHVQGVELGLSPPQNANGISVLTYWHYLSEFEDTHVIAYRQKTVKYFCQATEETLFNSLLCLYPLYPKTVTNQDISRYLFPGEKCMTANLYTPDSMLLALLKTSVILNSTEFVFKSSLYNKWDMTTHESKRQRGSFYDRVYEQELFRTTRPQIHYEGKLKHCSQECTD